MSAYKVCVYAICKNEEKFVDTWMDSMGEADQIIVTDTGSTDDTVARLRARGAEVFIEQVKPWRFDVARNLSLSHVPEDADICICTDLDEEFVPGWRKCLEEVWTPGTTNGKYLYNWSLKPDGTPDVQFRYFKVHNRHDWKWKHPVHEFLYYIGTQPQNTVFIPGMVLNHHPDPSKSRGDYLPLLEMGANENPQDDRMCYYLGREYMYKGQWDQCIQTLERHLDLPTAVWAEERCASMRWIASSYHHKGDNAEALRWYLRAVAEAPQMREPYVECALMGYRISDWPLSFYMSKEALKIKDKSSVYVNMGYAWDHTPDDTCAIACYQLGLFEQALQHALAALAISPDNERLKNNLMLIEERLAQKTAFDHE